VKDAFNAYGGVDTPPQLYG